MNDLEPLQLDQQDALSVNWNSVENCYFRPFSEREVRIKRKDTEN